MRSKKGLPRRGRELLENAFPGDAAWDEFAALYRAEYAGADAERLAGIMGGHLDIAVVICGKRGLAEGCWWVNQCVPALDGVRPLDCLRSPVLLRRLKTALMRMP